MFVELQKWFNSFTLETSFSHTTIIVQLKRLSNARREYYPHQSGAGSGKRDYSRPLPSEPDVNVSLHPAQASQRPCEGPVSSHTTCWLHDTRQKSMPLRGREHQC